MSEMADFDRGFDAGYASGLADAYKPRIGDTDRIVPAALLEQAAELIEAVRADWMEGGGNVARIVDANANEGVFAPDIMAELVAALRAAAGGG